MRDEEMRDEREMRGRAVRRTVLRPYYVLSHSVVSELSPAKER